MWRGIAEWDDRSKPRAWLGALPQAEKTRQTRKNHNIQVSCCKNGLINQEFQRWTSCSVRKSVDAELAGKWKSTAPHLFSVSGWEKKVNQHDFSAKWEVWRREIMSITSIYAKKTGRRFKGTSRRSPRKPIEGLKKWNQSDEESRKTCNMQMKSVECAAEGRKGAETRIFVARLVEFVKRSQRPVAAGNIGPF